MRAKDYLKKQYDKTRNTLYWERYKNARNELDQLKAALSRLESKLTTRLDDLTQAVRIKGSCAHHYKYGMRHDGVYIIDPDGLGSFNVRCDMTTNGGGWNVIQRRQDGSQDFYLGWSEYKAGFGDLNGEFWLGLDKIHRLSKSGQNVLRIDLMDFNGAERYAKYGTFNVADESDKYRLGIGRYSGDAGDSLAYHNQMKFTTKDSDNDAWGSDCAHENKGAWWYKSCDYSNLNGLYLSAGQSSGTGIVWWKWQRNYSLKKTQMKIRINQF
ncbi:techylectin-5B-like [Dendronephthya gigantea]|uniref:techylectin-5B-like n=1 Tax=Dendronephthya gigantea TaxID=151771 RepID=UPI00106DBEB5|nr:techylectin-5B-like [Dendronephthya gigantea]